MISSLGYDSRISIPPGSGKPRKKSRAPKVLLLLLILLAAAGTWAAYQYVRSGQVLIPLPEAVSRFVSEKLLTGGRLGPVVFGEYAAALDLQPDAAEVGASQLQQTENQAGQAAENAAGARTLPGQAVQPGQSGQAGQAGQVSRTTQTPPATPAKPGRVAPPDSGWRADSGVQYEAISEGSAQRPTGPGRIGDRQPSARDAALFEGLENAAGSSDSSLQVALPAAEGRAERPQSRSGEDSVVTPAFVDDLATYLAASYWPAGSHPSARGRAISTASVRSLNQRYGFDLHGFGGRASGGDILQRRSLVLNYVFMPSMLEALTGLYADRFAEKLAGQVQITDAKGQTRRLSKKQRQDMLGHYAAEATALSAAINAYKNNPKAAAMVESYIRAELEAQTANARYLDAKLSLEIAREDNDQPAMQSLAQELGKLETVQRRNLERQQQAESALRKMMNKGAAQRLSGSDLVYTACWLKRRNPTPDTLQAAAASLSKVAASLNARSARLKAE